MVQQASPALLPAVRIHFVSDDTLAARSEFCAVRRTSAEQVWAIQGDRPEAPLVGVMVDPVERVELKRFFFVILSVLLEGDRLEAQPVVSGLWRHLQSGVAQFLSLFSVRPWDSLKFKQEF